MRRAAIVSPLRTPIGKFLGAMKQITAGELSSIVIKALLERTELDPRRIDEVVFAQSYPSGEAPCIARWAALSAGLPLETPGYQIDRRCGSGLQSVIDAAMMVQTGAVDVVIAGGVESMSNVEYYSTNMRGGTRLGSVTLHDRLTRSRLMSQPIDRCGVISGMIETAENLAKDYGISREECDEVALRSQQRASVAWEKNRFSEAIVPVSIPGRSDEPVIFSMDEGIRKDTSQKSLEVLKPIEAGVVTAGNASQQSDAAAACLVVAEDCLGPLGLEPLGWFVSWAAAGCDPSRMGIGPVPAVSRLFEKTGLTWDAFDLVELNEAFAPQVLAVIKAWDWQDWDRLNVNGSAIALGHPIGATGCCILANLLYELRRRKGKYGLETMCIGGGQGLAAVFEAA